MASVAGLRGTGDWATGERPNNFREYILWRSPNGTAPIFALMSKVKKDSTDDPEFSWWDEPQHLIRLQVNGTVAVGVTTIVVDSPDPSVASPRAQWGLATHLKPGDLLLVEPAADAATLTSEIIEVTNIISPTQFMVRRGAAGTTPAEITNDLFLLHIGNAYAEGTDAPQATTRNPLKFSNYTQIFKTTYELTNTAAATHTRTGDPVQNDKKRKMFDHSKAIEMALIYGRKHEDASSLENGKPKRFMGGLREYIGNNTVFSATPTIDSILDAISPVFDYDTPAGNQRIAFCGNGTLNVINKTILNNTNTRVNYEGTIKQFGMELMALRFPQGNIFMRTHPLMNLHPHLNYAMLVLDFGSIQWRPLRGRDTKFKDDIQTKGEDLRKGEWKTEAGIEVDRAGLTQAYIGGFDNES